MTPRKKLILIISLVAVISIVAIIVGVVYSSMSRQADIQKAETVYIKDLDLCSRTIGQEIVNDLRAKMFSYVSLANKYNNQPSNENYQAVIRGGTCKTAQYGKNANTSTLILDIPDAKQSWEISYAWTPGGVETNHDLGTVTPTCLEADKLIYGDFKCNEVLNILEYGIANPDPIIELLPYFSEGFELKYTKETNKVDAIIVIRPSQKDNQTLINNLKSQVEYWFSHRDLDINKYSVTYTIETR